MKTLRGRIAVFVTVAWGVGIVLLDDAAPARADGVTHPDAGAETDVKPGANKEFLKPDLDVAQWESRFEKGGREIFDKRDAILRAIGLRPGMAVGDIGAGTGLFTMLFAGQVGTAGKVYAVDIAPRFLAHIRERATASHATMIETVRATDRSSELPPGSIDVAFICDVYHHFEYPKSTLASLARALRPHGALVLIDFRREGGKSSAWTLDHVRAGEAVFTSEIEAAGFRRVKSYPILKDNYVLRFDKR